MAKRSAYSQALREARRELLRLFRQREEIERKIARAKQTVVSLGRMCDDETDGNKAMLRHAAEGGMGLTDAIRTALMASERPLDPMDVRSALETVGYDIGSSPNTLVSIHTILGRLAAKGEIKQIGKRNKNGLYSHTAFWWGEYGIPKGWTRYPDKRMVKRWESGAAKYGTKQKLEKALERELERKALKGERVE